MAHSYARLFYHFIWATWDRTPLLTGEVQHQAYLLMKHQCETLGVTLHAIGGVEDHVHLLVTLPRTVCVSTFVKTVKGGSSRALNQAFARPAWHFKWQGRYGVHTVSPSQIRLILRYVENQEAHHTGGRLWPSSERIDEDD